MTKSKWLLLILVTLAVTAAPASAATTVGDPVVPVGATPDSATTGLTLVQVGSDPASFVVPARGVLTSWKVHYVSNAAGTWQLVTLRQGKVVGAAPATLASTGGSGPVVATSPARILVEPGDILGIAASPGLSARVGAVGGNPGDLVKKVTAFVQPGDTPALTNAQMPSSRLALTAQLEADADGDGHGDETQDACLGNGASFQAPCATDLAASLDQPAPVTAGGLALLNGSVRNAGPSPATGASVRFPLPTGVTFVDGEGAAGACAVDGDAIRCPVGTVAAGSTARALVAVRVASAGSFAVAAAARHDGADANATNDTETRGLESAAATAPPVVPPAATPLCTVPKLRALTRARAIAKLKAAGCATGKVRGPAKRSKVRSQTIPAGTRVAAGTKVGFRLARPKPRKR